MEKPSPTTISELHTCVSIDTLYYYYGVRWHCGAVVNNEHLICLSIPTLSH